MYCNFAIVCVITSLRLVPLQDYKLYTLTEATPIYSAPNITLHTVHAQQKGYGWTDGSMEGGRKGGRLVYTKLNRLLHRRVYQNL